MTARERRDGAPGADPVSAETLFRLGAERLAAILASLADADPVVERRLRMELAVLAGAQAAAAEVRRRITALRKTIRSARWDRRRELRDELEAVRAVVVERIAAEDPAAALDLMWRFMELAGPVFDHVDDSDGLFGDVFRAGGEDVGHVAAAAKPDPSDFADRVHAALTANGYGEFDHLLGAALPALGQVGLARLKTRFGEDLDAAPADPEHGWRLSVPRMHLRQIADAEGDVDAYVALVSAEEGRSARMAAEVGRRLLAAGRAGEALAALDAARRPAAPMIADMADPPDVSWESVRIDVLVALGRRDEAQSMRWRAFEQRLDADRLREFLRALPDFEDDLAEERALAHAASFASFGAALAFFHRWTAPARAEALVLARRREIDGNAYWLLGPAAEWLAGRHPLAASLLLRAMIEDTLDGAKAKRYGHAARHLLECASLAPAVGDFAGIEGHEAFVERLAARHRRKAAFWTRYADLGGRSG